MEWEKLLPLIDRKFNVDRCMERLRAIYSTDRWNSFDRYRETAEYCAQSMAAAGLEQIEKLPLQADGKTVYGDWKLPKAWKAGYGVLRYTDGEIIADYQKMPCCLSMYSPGTSGPVLAEVIDVTGLSELPKDGTLKGKVLLTDLRAAAILDAAGEAGAVGILSDGVTLFPGVRDSREEIYDDCLWEGLGQRNLKNTVFGFKLTPRQGDRMRSQLQQGSVHVVADIKAEYIDEVCETVSGLLPGRDPQLPEILAYGHLYEPGANDNASGSAALLELAACFQEAIEEGLLPRPRRSIRFAMGNECGGSMGYMVQHPERKLLCSGVFDMVGTENIDRARLSLRYDPVSNWSFADAALRAAARIHGVYVQKNYDFLHRPFHKGLGTDNINLADPLFAPGIAMVAAPATSYHSSMDTPERIEPDILKRNALILGLYLFGLADAEEETCSFLEQEIRAQTQALLLPPQHLWEKQKMKERMARALYSLRRICAELPFAEPVEEVPPIPEYAAAGEKIPVRKVPGCLTLDAHPELENPRWRPAWNAELAVCLFWADGKRNLWQIAVEFACEMEWYSEDLWRATYEKVEDYFSFLEELGYLVWKE